MARLNNDGSVTGASNSFLTAAIYTSALMLQYSAATLNHAIIINCAGCGEITPMQGRIWFGVLIGSTVGGFIPDLWGAGLLSYSSVALSAIGGFVGLWLVYKMN
jgi:hypothetical protein